MDGNQASLHIRAVERIKNFPSKRRVIPDSEIEPAGSLLQAVQEHAHRVQENQHGNTGTHDRLGFFARSSRHRDRPASSGSQERTSEDLRAMPSNLAKSSSGIQASASTA